MFKKFAYYKINTPFIKPVRFNAYLHVLSLPVVSSFNSSSAYWEQRHIGTEHIRKRCVI